MKPTIACPGCRAELELPVLPSGQTVQCPRCRHVFEPGLVPPPPPLVVAAPVPSKTFDVHSAKIPAETADVPHDLPPVTRYQPLRGEWKAPVAMALLALSLASYCLQLYVNFERSLVMPLVRPPFNGMQAEQLPEIQRRLTSLQRLSPLADVLHHLTYWPAAIMVLIWLHQASWTLRILRAGGVIFSPSSVVLAFFIPFLNFLQPYMVVQELWRASDPRATQLSLSWQQVPQSRVVIAWWLAIIAAALLSLAARCVCNSDHFCENPDRLLSARLWCASNIAMLIAGGTLFAIIRGIQVRQRARHAKIYDEV